MKMIVDYTIKVNGYSYKEQIVDTLTSNGYIVSSELKKSNLFNSDEGGWYIYIYKIVEE